MTIFSQDFWSTINIKVIGYRKLTFKIGAVPTKNCFCLFQGKPHSIFEPFISERQTTLHVTIHSSYELHFFFNEEKKHPTLLQATLCGILIWLAGFREKSEVHNPKAQKAPTLPLQILEPKGVVADQPQGPVSPKKTLQKDKKFEQRKKCNHTTPALEVKISLSYLFSRQLGFLLLIIRSYLHLNFCLKVP